MGRALSLATGPALLGGPVLGLFTAISVVISLLAAPVGAIGMRDRVLWVAVGLAAQVPVVIIVLLGRWLLRRRNDTATRGARLVVVVIAGISRGIVLHLGVTVLGLPGGTPAVPRVLAATVTTVAWMLLLGLVVASRDRFRRSYGRLFDREAAVAASVLGDAGTAQRIGAQVVEWGDPVVARLRGLHADAGSEAVAEAAQAIRELVRQRLRPLSHRLWFSDSARPPRPRLGPVLVESWRGRVLVDAASLTVFAVALAIGTVLRYPTSIGLPLVAWLAVIAAGSWLAIALLARILPAWAVNAIGVPAVAVALAFGPSLVTTVTSGEPLTGVLDEGAVMVSVALAFPLATTIIGMARVAVDDRGSLLALLRADRADLDAAIASMARQRREREVALYLHNHVKSQLTAHALRLGNVAAGGDADLDATVAAAIRVLTRPLPDDVLTGRVSALERLRGIAESWEGIAEVTVDARDLEATGEGPLVIAADVVAEAVANAVRGGGATSIAISTRVQQEGDSGVMLLEVRDNGRGSADMPGAGPGAPGLGSAWLDEVAPGMWHRRRDAAGATLEVRIPLTRT